jgi:hypothetical protein
MDCRQLKFIISIAFLLLSSTSFAQIRIEDKVTFSSIPFAQLIAPDGRLVGSSDMGGKIDTALVDRFVKSSDTLEVQHISYENQAMKWKDIKQNGIIRLVPRKVVIPEITVTNKKEKMVLVLEGYFRCYQLKDSVPEYYADGLVKYYIWNDGKRFKNKVEAYRLFRNQEILDKIKKRSITLTEGAPAIPYIEPTSILKQLNTHYVFKDSIGEQVILRENSVVGHIRMNEAQKQIQINIDWIAPAKAEERNLFGYEIKLSHNDIYETYRAKGQSMVSKANLECWRRYYQYFFKHKKEKRYKNIQISSEFYVLKSYYLPKSVMNEREPTSGFGLKESHSYTSEYWTQLGKTVPPLNPNIQKLLGTKLTMYE